MSNRQTNRVAVGMSGGMDSSVAAALLVERGFEATGLTLRMCELACRSCNPKDIESAQLVAKTLGIEHRVFEAVDVFSEKVLDYFTREYLAGRTPSPCIVCNEKIKFGFMLEKAVELGCETVATGHYAIVEREDDVFVLYRGKDISKDQSYFLHRLSQDQLSKIIFPLADSTKSGDVDQTARRLNLSVVDRDESRDLCFVEEGRHLEFMEERLENPPPPGPIMDSAGNRIGQHGGIHRYTIGQRKGLQVAWSEPLYVIRIIVSENTIVVGTRDETSSEGCTVFDINWTGQPPPGRFICDTQVRYRHKPGRSEIQLDKNGRAEVRFREPQFAVTPGQAAVFYEGRRVLGGGWIESSD